MREVSGSPNHIEFYTNAPREADAADDVVGSGIFSAGDANTHRGDGVFATNAGSLPGYAARENLLGRSEVIDRQTGTQIEVYVGGATSAIQRMPSSQPRYPWPDGEVYAGGAVQRADAEDYAAYPGQDISFMPADFVGPVTDTMAAQQNDHYRWSPDLGTRRGPWLGTGLPDGRHLPAVRGPARQFSGLGGGSLGQYELRGLGALMDEVNSRPWWQLLAFGLVAGVVVRMGVEELTR